MDEDIAIINSNTRNQRIKDFFTKNKKLFISLLIFLILILLSFYSYQIYQDKNKIKISDKYNSAIIKHKNGDNSGVISAMQEIVENKDHPWFVGVQFHPEYKSSVYNPHPIFVNFVKASLKKYLNK